jgi:hypothetical protein
LDETEAKATGNPFGEEVAIVIWSLRVIDDEEEVDAVTAQCSPAETPTQFAMALLAALRTTDDIAEKLPQLCPALSWMSLSSVASELPPR